MTVISKELFAKVAHKSCSEVAHPWAKSCVKAGGIMWVNSVYGSFNFFIIIYVLQLILRRKKVTTEYMKHQLRLFARSIIYGACMATGFTVFVCIFRHVLGKFYYYSTAVLPAFFSGLSILIESPAMQKLNTIMFFNLAVESIIRSYTKLGLIKRSPITDTAFFMCCNATLMYLLRTNQLASNITNIWFFSPPKRRKEENNSTMLCCDESTCWKHILRDGVKYFGAGYLFQVVKSSMSKVGKLLKHPQMLKSALLNKRALMCGIFFGTYVIIYKALCRELQSYSGEEKDIHCVIAGFLAGGSHYFLNNITFAVMAFTTVLQILFQNIYVRFGLPKWPYYVLLFALCKGYFFHIRIFCPDYCPSYIRNMITVTTNKIGDKVVESFYKSVWDLGKTI